MIAGESRLWDLCDIWKMDRKIIRKWTKKSSYFPTKIRGRSGERVDLFRFVEAVSGQAGKVVSVKSGGGRVEYLNLGSEHTGQIVSGKRESGGRLIIDLKTICRNTRINKCGRERRAAKSQLQEVVSERTGE